MKLFIRRSESLQLQISALIDICQSAWHSLMLLFIYLTNSRFMNRDALISLQILWSESHPQSHNQGPSKTASGSKEGLSIYGLFSSLARTQQGRYLLRQYFLRPMLDIDIINERLETVGIFTRPDNEEPLNNILKSLVQIKNIRTVMIHLRKGVKRGLNSGIRNGVWSTLRSVSILWAVIMWNATLNIILSSHFTRSRYVMLSVTWWGQTPLQLKLKWVNNLQNFSCLIS